MASCRPAAHRLGSAAVPVPHSAPAKTLLFRMVIIRTAF